MTEAEKNTRAQQKEETHQRILEAAARQFREEGLTGAGVQRIMEEAGLTHGGFYSHFSSKSELMVEALGETGTAQREQWLGAVREVPEAERLVRIVSRYLSRWHRDTPGAGCLLPALSADVSRAPECVRETYDRLLQETIANIESLISEDEGEHPPGPGCGAEKEAHARATGALALCVGGLLLARAAHDREFSDEILRSCRHFAAGVEGNVNHEH